MDGDKSALEEMVERRNRIATQARGLQARADRLHEKLKRLDAELEQYM